MSAFADRHYAMLELEPGCSLADARAAYRRLAKRNHPDLFPDEARARQQLRMMRINEAYMGVLAELTESATPSAAGAGVPPAERGAAAPQDGAGGEEAFFTAWGEKAKPGAPSSVTAVGSLRDPAYAYYKQGFRYFNLGATELSRKEAPKLRRYLATEGTADGYILRLALRALHYFERSYSYFLVVVERYPTSPWYADARWKLRRLEKFSAIYQRICENLSRRSSTRRSSFSMVRGADPS
ncbi:MAG: DnaJ domain-containing protein [Spirochaetota bacterium]